MRVLLDANIFVSYLLNPRGPSTTHAVVSAAFSGEFTLLVAEGLLLELATKAKQKKYLAHRISSSDVAALIDAVLTAGEMIPTIVGTIPPATRDRKDDYLLAYALVGQADYLVSGDDDLLVLGEVEGVKIVSPVGFLTILQQQD